MCNNIPIHLFVYCAGRYSTCSRFDMPRLCVSPHAFILSGQALIHGDLHTGSVMAMEGSTQVNTWFAKNEELICIGKDGPLLVLFGRHN